MLSVFRVRTRVFVLVCCLGLRSREGILPVCVCVCVRCCLVEGVCVNVTGFTCRWVKSWCSAAFPLGCDPCRQWLCLDCARLMSGFAALQRTVPPPCWCGAAEHHSSPTALQSYKSPTVRPGPNRTATAGDGQVRRGRRRCRGANESVRHVLRVHLHLCPLPCFTLRSSLSLSLSPQPMPTKPLFTTSSQSPAPPQLLPLIAFINVSMGAAARSNLLIMCCISTGPGAGMEHRGTPGWDSCSPLLRSAFTRTPTSML